jgi:hypothetical protein
VLFGNIGFGNVSGNLHRESGHHDLGRGESGRRNRPAKHGFNRTLNAFPSPSSMMP